MFSEFLLANAFSTLDLDFLLNMTGYTCTGKTIKVFERQSPVASIETWEEFFFVNNNLLG